MLSKVINRAMASGVLLSSATSLSSGMNAGPQDRMLLQKQLKPQSTARWGSGSTKRRQMGRDKAEHSSLSPSIRLWSL